MNIEELEEKLYKLSLEKFEIEGKIESIQHQLDMSLYRKENGEEVDYLWLNKTKFKLNMLKIEIKKLNLDFDKTKKEVDGFYKKQREIERFNRYTRLERVVIDFIKADYGEQMIEYYFDKAKEHIKFVEGILEEKENEFNISTRE